MRNFEERKAEVFRRSEKRIIARKRRRSHMLMACIPVVLCIALLMPGFPADDKKAAPNAVGSPESVMDDMPPIVYEGHSQTFAGVAVSGAGFSGVVEGNSAKRIYEYLCSFDTRGMETNKDDDGEVVEEKGDSAHDIIEDAAGAGNHGYTITLVIGESKTVYYLEGNVLENRTTDQSYALTEKQRNELTDLLGIPRP